MLALLNVAVADLPVLTADTTGTITYNASTNTFVATAQPLSFKATPGIFVPARPISTPRDFRLEFKVDSSGNLMGGIPGNDFVVSGSIDINGDNVVDVSGDLLTGEVLAFGFEDSGTASDTYDLRLSVTGGALAVAGTLSGGAPRPAYFAGRDIGLIINSENSTFTSNFAVDFSGKNKSLFGPINQLPAQLGNFVWNDLDQDGIQDANEPGIDGVSVTLTNAAGNPVVDFNNNPVAAQTTSGGGGYLFTNLVPGT